MNSSTYGEKLWSSGNNSGESCYVTEVRPKEETYPAQPHTRQLVKVMRYALPCLTVKLEAVDGEIKLLLPASFAVIDRCVLTTCIKIIMLRKYVEQRWQQRDVD